jgi:lactoylglutathione lyase
MSNENPPINIKQAIPFFMVKDMEASLAFYTGKLGFTIAIDWQPRGKIEWCWLTRDAIAIMLQEPRSADHPAFVGEMPGKGMSICFQCMDALALYHEFTAKGVEIQEPFVGNNLWVVAFNDPDGYRLDFESPTDVAEETRYSEWVK